MRSKPILHGQVTQSLLLLSLGSSQRHDIRTARPTPNATRSRRDQGNAQPYPPPPPRGPGTTWVPQVSGTKYQAARGVEEATAKQLRPRPDRTPSIAIPVDSDASPRKNTPETVTSPLVNGEKSIFRDQVRGYSALGSPLRREVGNRHNIVSVTIVSTLSLSGVIPTEPLTWKLIKVWLPVNIIFVGMLITSMFSLKYINVAMLTILKNVANVLTASGETYFFKKQHDRQVWISLTLMLTLRHVMDSAKQATKSGNLNELSMVLLNNILSVPLGIILVLGFNEVEYLFETLVGSLNKIPLSIAGILLFKVRTSMENSFSILFGRLFFNNKGKGLLAGVFFARAKLLNNSQS
ncbi:hypothetical protein OsJ_25762 [Oryza sativa Japonica Group]|uniref:Sugar phosphate transporter domain-containing protein n=1 Tax=Oryza sativa subsp. japonica TaxID=39947 RepID=B9FYP4_ORYSJ|nr:hypothetical protein OsJ_25762 [Oryza sativa Japonica Group]